MTGMWGPLGIIGGAVLRGAGCGTGVLLLVRPPAAVLWWLIGCWLLYQAGAALGTAGLAPAARARDRAARVRLLRAVERLGAVQRMDMAQRLGAAPGHWEPGSLRDHLYAAAGVAIRWEPKPGAAVAVLAHLTGSLLTLAGLAAALAVVDPALAVGVGLCVALALGLVMRPRGRRAGATGRAGWDARRRASRTVAVLVGVLAAGAALVPLLAAARRPDAAVGLCSAAVLLARLVYGLTAVDLTALRHRRVTRRHLREVERAAAPGGGEPGAAPAGIVVVPARPGRLGFADLAENVHLGALGPDDSVPERLPRTVRLCRLDALARSLPRGWRTVPSAEFSGGVDLDEETWRRIAAARVSALLERGATEVLLPGEPDPCLAAVLADWSSRAGVRVRVCAGPEGAAPGGAEPEEAAPGGAEPEEAAW
ncbi:hypothetical protein QT196_02615 [Streptomyces sp. P9-2B-2]|uniref:hypothetical protein n=1 Tax=Streptomyces sp. P9-2B-2 TaxID=3057114 RepID=UPI0025B3C98D|nr:hypothetical protein [Streptomyces sp. P9-2B-2]WJY36246.1 hypothetical protein QT196_02615 [Streptomyces sp. P9-2B-2]